MDLGTIDNNLQEGAYSTYGECLRHMRLVFDNAMAYNPPGHSVHSVAKRMKHKLEDTWGSVSLEVQERKDNLELLR
ncbi:GTE8, partial [Symbiodinium sp. KB8]